jgi:hypothetical protein
LFHLGNMVEASTAARIYTADMKFVIVNRVTDELMADKELQVELERAMGSYCLEALVRFQL